MTPTHIIVARSYWAACSVARKHRLNPDTWIYVLTLTAAQHLVDRSQSLGVDFAPVIVTPTRVTALPVDEREVA